jgi:hypothetical protein
MYAFPANVEHEMFCDTSSSHWSHRNSNQRTEKIPGRNTKQAFHRVIAKNCHPGNITHTRESATVRRLKPEWLGAPLVQGKEHRGKPVLRDDDDDDHNNNNNNNNDNQSCIH